MSGGKRVTFDASGIHVFDGADQVRSFQWGTGGWTVDLLDSRLPTPAHPLGNGELPEGRPRITSIDEERRDQDRNLLGLPTDHSADLVLLLNPTDGGTLTLHYGPLDLHSVPVSAEWARALILEAVNRGFEVRRRMLVSGGKGGSFREALVSQITTRRAADTPEWER